VLQPVRNRPRRWGAVVCNPACAALPEIKNMTHLIPWPKLFLVPAWLRKIGTDLSGQDMIEYALMAGFVAVASAAASPHVTASFSTIFSKINSALIAQGGG
jgi:pilus assembly protein Flp/PilA